MADQPLSHSPLHDRHEALGATFAEFGGWLMPLEYRGGGVRAEHTAVREAVGIFDVSHLGKCQVTGPGAVAFLNRCLSNDLGKIGPGQAQYTLCCNESGGVIDDLIAYVKADDEVLLIPNAANNEAVIAALAAADPGEVTLTNRHADFAVIAIQGPQSETVVAAMGLPTDMGYYAFETVRRDGWELTVCRTGYTGEKGYELVVPAAHAGEIWDEAMAAGQASGIRPAGLGARDTLRLEMGYPLHGHDLAPDVLATESRVGWAIGWRKPEFFGRDALLASKAAGPARLLRGLEALKPGIAREGMTVRVGDAEVGHITSGNQSITRRVGIALALLDRSVAEGDEVVVDVRGRELPMRVTKPPFVTPDVKS